MPKYSDPVGLHHPMLAWVLGFLFNEDRTKVILLKKTHPDYQAGKLNGVGGKVEPNETILDAMTREFLEETGITWKAWHHYCSVAWNDGIIYCYKGFAPQQTLDGCHTTTDEVVKQYGPYELFWYDTMPNLHWMVSLAACTDDYKPVFVEARW